MNIKIEYTKEKDEFAKDLTLEMRLDRYVKAHFYPAYAVSMLAPTYLVGGGIRNLIFAEKPKDLDFIVVGNEYAGWLQQVLEKYNIEYGYNRFGGYKLTYKDTVVDIWTADDLFSAIEYNADGLFYDIQEGKIISLTFDDFLENGLKKINDSNNIEGLRKEKLLRFEDRFKKSMID